MKNVYSKIKAFLGFTLFLYFPLGFFIDLTQYTNIATVLVLSICAGSCGSLLILPYIRTLFNLSLEQAPVKTAQTK